MHMIIDRVVPQEEVEEEADSRFYDAFFYVRAKIIRMTGTRRKDLSWRQQVFLMFEDPFSSPEALVTAAILISSILLSVVSLFLSTLPQNWLVEPNYLKIIELVTTVIFTIDFLVRLLTAPVWWRWLIRPMTIIDFLSTLPFYLDLILKATVGNVNSVRLLRILRVLRILKLGRFSDSFQVLSRTLTHTIDGIALFLSLYILGFMVFGTLVFFAELTVQTFDSQTLTWYREDGIPSPFQSIPDCFWWAVVTMTTTGYGDEVPVSDWGKLVGAVAMVYGVVMLSFPVAILGNQFHFEWKDYKYKQLSEADKRGVLERDTGRKRLHRTNRELAALLRDHLADTDRFLIRNGPDRLDLLDKRREDLVDLWCECKVMETGTD